MSGPIGLEAPPANHVTKQRLLDAGLALMLERGYHAIGVQDVLAATGTPKGSFYHHFESKEDFALQVVDQYQSRVRELLEQFLGDRRYPPLLRVRNFFAGVRRAYEQEGYLGCFLGSLGQEMSGASDIFRRKIDGCITAIVDRIAVCLEEACARGDLPATCNPKLHADLIVTAWEGAALRSRLVRGSRPLENVLDFCFAAMRES
jgi:TetR/AcrR family transcriptional repressor of nem operon